MKPFGLVLAGGGGKGAYQIGAWEAMREIGVRFDAIAGVSIGSINGALIAADDFKAATDLWNNISLDKGVNISTPLPDPENLFSTKNWGVLFKEFVKNGGFDASPVKDFLSQYIDESKVRASKIPFGLVTVQMTQGMTGLELFINDIPEGQLIDYLLASSNIPLANNIGPEGEKFLDGGVYDNTPVSMLKKNGWNRLVVIDISTIKGVNHSLDFLNSNVVYIRPYNIDDLGASFDFDSENVKMRMRMGYLDAKKAFSYLCGKIFYFSPKTFKNMVFEYGADAVMQLEELAYELKVERLCVYTQKQFLSAVKKAFDEKNAEEEKKAKEEKDAKGETEESEKDKHEKHKEKSREKDDKEKQKENSRSSLFHFFFSKKEEKSFDEAVALLQKLS